MAEKEVKTYPKIRGGICEFCGIPAKDCPHFKEMFQKGTFRCLCGGSSSPSTFEQSIYWYAPSLKAWICNSDGCRRMVEAMGGYRDPEIMKFFMP